MSIDKLFFDAAGESVIGIIVSNKALFQHILRIAAFPGVDIQMLPAVIFMR
jgi:hypothetical protein